MRTCNFMQSVDPSAALHQQWFTGLLFRRLPSTMEALHSQRLLLMYFGALGGSISGAPWAHRAVESGRMTAAIVAAIQRCYDPHTGGFFAEPSDDFVGTPTLTMTHCALYVLRSLHALRSAASDWLSLSTVRTFVSRCLVQRPSESRGAYAAFPESSEIDVRFTYSALMILFFISEVDRPLRTDVYPTIQMLAEMVCSMMDVEEHQATQSYVLRCWSPHEGAFGGAPWTEAHGGMTFCAVASLALLGWWTRNDSFSRCVRRKTLSWCVQRHGCGPVANEEAIEDEWMHWERVGDGRGFQGRPNKPHDTCYTFWIGAAFSILESIELNGPLVSIDGENASDDSLVDDNALRLFVLSCAGEKGGFGRDGQDPDPLHSALGLAGLSCRVSPIGQRLHPILSSLHPMTE